MRDLKFAGDVEVGVANLISLNGQAANIINQIVTIEIYEDLLSPFISLSITLKESQDFMNLFPFIGEEYLVIDIATPGIQQKISGKFYVYKMVDRTYTSEREVLYTIKGISEEFLTDVNTKVTKSIEGNIAESALKVFTENYPTSKKPKNIDPTVNRIKFVPNYWSPVECLNHLAKHAVSQFGSPSFLYFENRQGLNFVSINNLLRQKPYQEFVKDNFSRDNVGNATSSVVDPTEDYKRIIDIDMNVISNYIDDVTSGQIKSRLVSHDILTKRYSVQDYSIKKDPNKFVLLNKSLPYSKYSMANSAATMIYRPKYYNNFDGHADTTDSKIIQKRLSFFKNLEKHKLELEVIGRSDYTVGQVISLELPKVAQITKDDPEHRDLMLSGNYLVTAITHYINRAKHVCKMEIVKNSVLFDLEKA